MILSKLLTGNDESGGLNMGDLIIHLLRKAGTAVLAVLPDLLHAMVKRMMKAQTATFLQVLKLVLKSTFADTTSPSPCSFHSPS